MSPFDRFLRSVELSDGTEIEFYSLQALEEEGFGTVSSMPFSLKIVLESLMRMQGHPAYTEEHVASLAAWRPRPAERREYPYMPSRVLLQDFTGVPCVVDLAALRSALQRAGRDPALIEPEIDVDLVIDHSVQVDDYGRPSAFDTNLEREFERNRERYVFLRWGQQAFERLDVLPPGLGICHQVNMEHLASCVTMKTNGSRAMAFPDTLVGTDSHTTMINSMGILGWGVGGIEAEAAMLGQPIPILTPVVTGVRLTGRMPPGVTPTDLALTVTKTLREKGVVGHFIEYFGPGLESLSLADRAPVANMSPEYGATMGFFPVDAATLQYLRVTGRSERQVELVEKYCRAQGLFHTEDTPDPEFDDVVEVELSHLEPSVAGPKRPQDRVAISDLAASFENSLTAPPEERGFGLSADQTEKSVPVEGRGELNHGSVVIAAVTSCTNTSNPGLLLGAGILAKKAAEKGLSVPAHVKTSLAPGSRVVTEYLQKSGLLPHLENLGFHLAAYGCTTCIGNSGPLPSEIAQAIERENLVAAAVLSGNRNFEGRIHALTQANYLCSPPLVVAYALKGTVDADLTREPLGTGSTGNPVYLRDVWPTAEEIASYADLAADPELYKKLYQGVEKSSPRWNELPDVGGAVYDWDEESTYIREPAFFQDMPEQPPGAHDIENAAVLGLFGDFVTTDHISPAGAIPVDGPAGRYLVSRGVEPSEFNSFGSRRGNHEVMMRGTFANVRIRNHLVDRTGGWTMHHPTGEEMPIYDAAMKYREDGVPLVIVAGRMYGAGSSRDWAAKGTYLLGVKAVLAESFERIHRSNLVEMGVLPLEFANGETAGGLGLTGRERFSVRGISDGLVPGKTLQVEALRPDGSRISFPAKCRIDSNIEIDYYRHGGILQYVLRGVMNLAD